MCKLTRALIGHHQVIGELQHITYKEWLPIILGEEYMETNDMRPMARGYTNKYSQEVNPGITNVFATAAFRSVHLNLMSFPFQMFCYHLTFTVLQVRAQPYCRHN